MSQRLTSQHYLDTGQRTCHADDGREIPCEGSGQDASFAVGAPWPEPRFEVRDDEVMDRLTGLIWCRSANLAEFPLTWQEALDFVATMNREQRFGQRDWRMPNRRELRSLLSLQTKLPALPEQHPVHRCVQRLVLEFDDGGHQPGARLVRGARWRPHVLRRQGSILHAVAGARRRPGRGPAHGPEPVLRHGRQSHCMRRFRPGRRMALRRRVA